MANELMPARGHGPRRSVLDLAPLELDCMNTLWPMGEATVYAAHLAPDVPTADDTAVAIYVNGEEVEALGVDAERERGAGLHLGFRPEPGDEHRRGPFDDRGT